MVKINPNEAVRSLNKAGNEIEKQISKAPEKMHEVSEETLKNVSDAQTAAGKAQLKKYVKPETDVEPMEVENQFMAASGTHGDDVIHDEGGEGGGSDDLESNLFHSPDVWE